MRTVWITTFATTLAACQAPDGTRPAGTPWEDREPATGLPSADPSTTPDDGPKEPIADAALFAPDHVVEVELTLPEADWTALRRQNRSLFDIFGGDCLSEPFSNPFTWFAADVRVDGEALGEVGLRKKGFLGSLSETRPSLKIDTDRWVDGQLLANGTERVTLNNALQDPSYLNACLGYGVFRAAGLPAPRCNFATVRVNGDPLGVYVHVEAVKKDFLRRHFSAADGDLYEGNLSDFTEGWSATFEAKTDDTDPAFGPVQVLMAALEAPDETLMAELEPVLDLEAFYRFWAAESLIGHWDGYASNANNFFLYRDPGDDRIRFVPWGADALFEDAEAPAAGLSSWLVQRLWALPEGRAAYAAAMRDLLAGPWDEGAILAEVDRMEALLAPHLEADGDAAFHADRIRDFVQVRRGAVEDQLAFLEAHDLEPAVRDPFCFEDLGAVTATFDTVMGSLEDNPFDHDATLSGDLIAEELLTGATAGLDAYGELTVATLGVDASWSHLYQLAAILPPNITPGTYALDSVQAVAFLLHLDLSEPEDEGNILGFVHGEITLDAIGGAPGDPVVGSVDGTVLGGLF